MTRIQFACDMNFCQSQMAESYCRALGRGVKWGSAGMHSGAVRAMAEVGIDMSGNRSDGMASPCRGGVRLLRVDGLRGDLSVSARSRGAALGHPGRMRGTTDQVGEARDMIRENVVALLRELGCFREE